jgi:hypothetical protein
MDSKKDNKNTGNDLKGQTQKTFYYQAPIASPLSDNPKIKDIECRSEKVSVALYLITDLFEKGEPLQYSIRQNVTELRVFSLANCSAGTSARLRPTDAATRSRL